MALTGAIYEDYGIEARIRDDSGAWETVKTIDGDNLPGTRYAFWVTGVIGSVSWGRPDVLNHEMLVTVARRGSNFRADQINMARFKLADSLLGQNGPNGARDGIPFQMLVVLDPGSPIAAHPQFGSSWEADADFLVLARVERNGDPSANASFVVSDLSVMVWDLATLSSEGITYLAEEYNPAQAQNLSGTTTRYLTLGSNPPGATGETFLVFHSVVYRPYDHANGSPRFALTQVTDGTVGTLTTLDEFGMNGREHTGNGAGSDWKRRHVHGGIAVYVQPAGSAVSLGWWGVDSYDVGIGQVPPFQTEVFRCMLFAVRLKNAAEVEDLYGVNIDEPNVWPASVTNDLASDVGSTQTPFEVNVPAPTSYVALHQARFKTPSPNTIRSYLPIVSGDSLTPTLFTWKLQPQIVTERERIPYSVQHVVDDGLPGGNSRFENSFWAGIFNAGYGETRPGNHYRAVGFFFETDPSNLADGLDPIGLPLVIVPDREALAPASVTALPVQPDRTIPQDQTVKSSEFRSGPGYVWRLPKLTMARRSLILTFSGRTATERDSLLAFFREQPTFSWALPDEPDAVWLVVERPSASPVAGTLYNITVRVLELVFTGNPTLPLE